jgi:hypothetical protein
VYYKGLTNDLSWLGKTSMDLLLKTASKAEIDDSTIKVILDYFLATVFARISIMEWPETIDIANIAIQICNRIHYQVYQIKVV